jgi:hypothetical protein
MRGDVRIVVVSCQQAVARESAISEGNMDYCVLQNGCEDLNQSLSHDLLTALW